MTLQVEMHAWLAEARLVAQALRCVKMHSSIGLKVGTWL